METVFTVSRSSGLQQFNLFFPLCIFIAQVLDLFNILNIPTVKCKHLYQQDIHKCSALKSK